MSDTAASTVGVLVPAACALLIAAGLLVGAGPTLHGGVDRPAQGTQCVPTGPRESVADLNRFVSATAGVPGFLGADVGVDVRLEDGRSIWIFADTLQHTPAGEVLTHNSMLVFTPGCVRLVDPGDGTAVIPDRDDGVAYWPMSAWSTPSLDGEYLYVMAQRVEVSTSDVLGMRTLGPAVAVFDVPPGEDPRLVRLQDLGIDDPSPASPGWGAAAALDEGWLYLYGTSSRELPGIHGFALRVARLRPEGVFDRSSWLYWDGLAWQSDPDRAAPLIDEVGGVSQTLSVWRQDGRWYVLSQQDEVFGTDVAVWPGNQPSGPFGPPHVVAELRSEEATGELRYMPLAHPGLLPQAGTVVVSYSRNYLDFGEVCANPRHYRPYFLRVALP